MSEPATFQLPDDPKPDDAGKTASDNPAADLIRSKLKGLYTEEPDAKIEALNVSTVEPGAKLSKHQKFMLELTNSRRSLAEIQTDWHDYYNRLPDSEKHEVWQEFYTAHAHASKHPTHGKVAPEKINTPAEHKQHHAPTKPQKAMAGYMSRSKSIADLKSGILNTIVGSKNIKAKHHLQSMFFGLGMGALVLLIFVFGFFNERFVAPFITPNKTVTNTPIIADSGAAIGPEPKIIIPKINVEIPVVYDEPSVEEKAVQDALEKGVVHYASTSVPGEQGNAVIVGHSSNNIFNKGAYKFAFVLLGRLETGDTFMLHKDGKRYTYRVFDKKIVKPTDVSVLQNNTKPATVTLITCDPPGTSLNRLVIVAEQISPDPAANVASNKAPTLATTQPSLVPGNAPSLWSRLTGWIGN